LSTNVYVTEILKYSYEFARSVVRPEVSDSFADLVYIPTLLDTALVSDLAADEWDLVLVTGNPGDGKSAFFHSLETLSFCETAGGRPIRLRHDATEPTDSADHAASALDDLGEFLAPVLDSARRGVRPEEVFVLGINKGLLVRAFLAQSAPLALLGESVGSALASGYSDADGPRVRVVDLNNRAIASFGREESPSLFDKVLARLTALDIWEGGGCTDCESASWCPFLANARLARRPEVAARLELLWLVQQLEADRHSTLRDLFAALAYVLVGHADMFHQSDDRENPVLHPCQFVQREHAAGDWSALFRRLMYNAVFVDDDVYEGLLETIAGFEAPSSAMAYGMAPTVVADHMNKLDPCSGVSTPSWDRIEEKVVKNPIGFLRDMAQEVERRGSGVERAFFEAAASRLNDIDGQIGALEADDGQGEVVLDLSQRFTQMCVHLAKRWQFLVSADATSGELTAYRGLSVYLDALRYCAWGEHEFLDSYETVMRDVIPDAIAAAEELEQFAGPGELWLRWSGSVSDVGAVLVVPVGRARLECGPKLDPYVEYAPLHLDYLPTGGPEGQVLRMDLRCFEGVFRLSQGYSEGFSGVPRSHQFRNFRDNLRSQPPSGLVIVDESRPDATVSITMQERMRFE
jgi:hypothetical protein